MEDKGLNSETMDDQSTSSGSTHTLKLGSINVSNNKFGLHFLMEVVLYGINIRMRTLHKNIACILANSFVRHSHHCVYFLGYTFFTYFCTVIKKFIYNMFCIGKTFALKMEMEKKNLQPETMNDPSISAGSISTSEFEPRKATNDRYGLHFLMTTVL